MREIKPHLTTSHGITSWQVIIPPRLKEKFGGRSKPTFRYDPQNPERDELSRAQALCNQINSSEQCLNSRLLALSDEAKIQLLSALDLVEWHTQRLIQGALLFNARNGTQVVDLEQAMREYHTAELAGKSVGHKRRSLAVLEDFWGQHAGKAVRDILAKDISDYLGSNPSWSSNTRRHYYAILHAFWAWACLPGRKYCNENIVKATTRPAEGTMEIGYYTVDQQTELLRAAWQHDRSLITPLAVGLFMGPRKSELCQMTSAMRVNGHVNMPGSITKTGEPRYPTISPTLNAWLQLVNDWSFSIGPQPKDVSAAEWEVRLEKATSALHHRIKTVAKLAGVKIVDNGLRHTFATHSKAVLGWVALAEEMGNSEDKLKRHYKGEIEPSEVRRWNTDNALIQGQPGLGEMMPEQVLGELLNSNQQAA